MPDTALSVADVSALARERDRRQFADYVRLHATNRKFVPRDEETTLLKTAIADFGMDRDQARGVLGSIASEQGVYLESQADQSVRAFLAHKARKLKVARKDFMEATAMYRRMVNNGLTKKDSKKRVKEIMIREGMQPRRIRLLFIPLVIPGAKRWYNRIRV